jgi:hypothetical protein
MWESAGRAAQGRIALPGLRGFTLEPILTDMMERYDASFGVDASADGINFEHDCSCGAASISGDVDGE